MRETVTDMPLVQDNGRIVRRVYNGPLPLHDSFLIREGKTLGIDEHINRLVASSGCGRERATSLYAVLFREASTLSAWAFPLITVQQGEIQYRLRSIDPSRVGRTVSLWTSARADPRLQPEHKGPDFPAQTELRELAQQHGADEAVLLGPNGMVREGAYSTLVYWQSGRLILAPPHGRLPSITEKAVVRIAREAGIPVETRGTKLFEMRDGWEVWALSSLHGIRVVAEWDGQPLSNAGFAKRFRQRMSEMEESVIEWTNRRGRSPEKQSSSATKGAHDEEP